MSLKVAWFGDSTLEPEMRYHGFKVCAWFQPLNLKCDILVSSLCFQMGQLVCRYTEEMAGAIVFMVGLGCTAVESS